MRITPGENIRVAITSVWSHRFRSLLTILGIVIGITTVVTVSSLLTGVRQGVVTFFQEFGPDNIFLNRVSGDPSSPGLPHEQKRRPLRPDYAEAILRLSPSVTGTAVQLYIPSVTNGQALIARAGGLESDRGSVAGHSYESLEVQPRELREGRLFTAAEAARGERVCMIGASLAEALFPGGNAVGGTMFVGGAEFRVLGVFEAAKGGFFGENGLDFQITIPLRTAQLRYPQADRYIIVSRAAPGRRDDAFEEVRNAVRRLRGLPPSAPDDFTLSTPDQIIARLDSITGMILLVSIALSALGLLVGGIGVMNIMLVSVTERTREIGIRKAIGARKPDIVLQFLVEAVSLTGLGGVLGIVIAVLVTMLVGALVPALPSVVPAWAVAAGFLVSVLVGLFFGVWPAFKAAQLDPVEALRYE
jgi:putative ABC transport system permease protein